MIQAALLRCGLSLAEIRTLTGPEIESYLSLFSGRGGGCAGKRYAPLRRKGKRQS